VKSHEEQAIVRFGDADPAGIIFYPRLIDLAHGVVENLIRHSAIGWSAWFDSPTHAMPIRKAEADFLRPMGAGESFKARAGIEKVGETSVTIDVAFRNNQGEVAARVRTVHVCVDKSTGQPTKLPDDIRRILEDQSD
jgi:acyl-CoA thioesterase FadM